MKEFIEKLIGKLEEKKSEHLHDEEVTQGLGKINLASFCSAKARALDGAIEIVNQLAEEYNVSEMPTGWIACSERLPEDGVVVDLSCEYMGVLYETVGYLKDGNRGHSYIVDNDVFMRSAVLAWRKRPAPYQPKGE